MADAKLTGIKTTELGKARLIDNQDNAYAINYTHDTYMECMAFSAIGSKVDYSIGLGHDGIIKTAETLDQMIKRIHSLTDELLGKENVIKILNSFGATNDYLSKLQILRTCVDAIGKTFVEQEEAKLKAEIALLDNM